MQIINILGLIAGLGLFLFGMKYMGEGLNQVAGNKMKDLLEKLTRNPVKGFLLGVFVTAIIQSSSAATVMVMGFLNAGIMDLIQATSVIIGTHIGTTVTAVLIAIDVSFIAPVCIFIGMIMVLFSKHAKWRYVGQIVLGFGLLFFGLKYMSGDNGMGVLKSNVAFQNFIAGVNNPFLGIIIGIIICSVLQSSSASIGVLQMIALNGILPIHFAMFIIIGINLGSVTPLALSSIGAKTNAKRAALVYFTSDFVGMLIFTPIALFTPFTDWIAAFSDNGSVQVAAAHIIFKTVTALVILPLRKYDVKLSQYLIKDKEHESALRFTYIDKNNTRNMVTTALQVRSEIERMAQIVNTNIDISTSALLNRDLSKQRELLDNEELINWLNHNISDFLVTMTSHELDPKTSEIIIRMFHVITDLERIGDHALNIFEKAQEIVDGSMHLSEEATAEVQELCDDVKVLYNRSVEAFNNLRLTDYEAQQLHKLEDEIDALTIRAQDKHVERLREKKCSTSTGVIFTKLLQDLERIGDHAYNIAWEARRDKALIKQI